jgi:aryl-alcohol dehydrogenase-like predicted oxidoreductase
VRHAHDRGIRHFDTASVYGQGDSERCIGEALRSVRDEVVISSKAGQRLSPKQALLAHFKGPIRWMAGHTQTVRQTVADQRSRGVPRCFDPSYIARSLDGSLKRLGTSYLDVFYLHSPQAEVLNDSALKDTLLALRQSGRFKLLGVSCDDYKTALTAARDPDIQVVQFALSDSEECQLILDTIQQRGKAAVVRGLLSQNEAYPNARNGLADRLRASLAHPAVKTVIVGTTKAVHVDENVLAFAQATTALN